MDKIRHYLTVAATSFTEGEEVIYAPDGKNWRFGAKMKFIKQVGNKAILQNAQGKTAEVPITQIKKKMQAAETPTGPVNKKEPWLDYEKAPPKDNHGSWDTENYPYVVRWNVPSPPPAGWRANIRAFKTLEEAITAYKRPFKGIDVDLCVHNGGEPGLHMTTLAARKAGKPNKWNKLVPEKYRDTNLSLKSNFNFYRDDLEISPKGAGSIKKPPSEKPAEKSPQAEDKPRNYYRLRWLYSKYKDSLSEYDDKFIRTVGTAMRQGKPMTPKQSAYVDRLLDRYKVPPEATANE